jgi:hypothetical protein
VHQAIFIAFPQYINGFIIGNFPTHAMLDTPSGCVTHENACFQ